eukprot:1237331-Prymnesium_polylepis.3
MRCRECQHVRDGHIDARCETTARRRGALSTCCEARAIARDRRHGVRESAAEVAATRRTRRAARRRRGDSQCTHTVQDRLRGNQDRVARLACWRDGKARCHKPATPGEVHTLIVQRAAGSNGHAIQSDFRRRCACDHVEAAALAIVVPCCLWGEAAVDVAAVDEQGATSDLKAPTRVTDDSEV